jgi:Tfp pilus assembly protein PilF
MNGHFDPERAQKALELDGALAEGHDTLATQLFAYEWDWASAEREYQRAIELSPNYANVHCFYSLFLYAMRRPQEAKMQIERALDLDPFSAFFHTARAVQLVQQRRTDDALRVSQRAATLQPDSHYVHYILWRVFDQKQEYEKALAEAKECYKLLAASDVVEALEAGYGQGGYQGALRRAGDALALESERSSVRLTVSQKCI